MTITVKTAEDWCTMQEAMKFTGLSRYKLTRKLEKGEIEKWQVIGNRQRFIHIDEIINILGYNPRERAENQD